jgi:protein-disulfide isomerase
MRSVLALLVCVGCVAAKPTPDVHAPASSPVVATAATFSVTEAELADYLQKRPKLARAYYDLRHGALEEMVLDRLVTDAAKKAKVPEDTWIQAEIEKRTTKPSALEIKTFFETRLLPENPSADLANEGPRIRSYLMQQRGQEALHKLISELREAAQVKLEIPAPRVPIGGTGPSKGLATAPITVVEFSDYECPYCQRQEDSLKQLLQAYPSQVRLVVRDFPLDMHPDARRAARAAVCADQQGRFWEMHDRMFQDPRGLDDEGLLRSAKELGLDVARFEKCTQAPETEQAVAQSQRDGEEAGVDGTPALFMNGRPLTGAVGFDELKALVDEELAASAPAAKRN